MSAQGRNQKLRADRLVYYAEDIAALNQELDAFLELSQARAAFVVDREGHMVARRGDCSGTALESIAALVAGSFAATRELARLVGEAEFTSMSHQGARDSIQIALLGERALFAAVYDQRSNLGLVRWHAKESCGRMASVLQHRSDVPPPALPGDYAKDAAAALDQLL